MRLPLHRLVVSITIAMTVTLSSGAIANDTRIVAPPLYLPGLDGTKLNLYNWRDQIVVLVFWATWCEPCIAEVPDLVALEDKYRQRGLSIVSVGIDDTTKLGNVVRTLGINYPVMVANPDTSRPMLAEWGNKQGVIPYTVIIDRTGRMYATHRGPIYREELEALIQQLLNTTSGKQAKR